MTEVLKLPVPDTEAEHGLVWPVWIELGVQATETELIVGEGAEGVGVTLPLNIVEPPPQPVSSRGTATIASPYRRIEHPILILASRMNDCHARTVELEPGPRDVLGLVFFVGQKHCYCTERAVPAWLTYQWVSYLSGG